MGGLFSMGVWRSGRIPRAAAALVLAGLVVLAGFGCGGAGTPAGSPTGGAGTSPKAAAKPVKLGVVIPTSGGAATLGEQALHGVRDAIEDINAGGGIKSLGGALIEVVAADHQGKTELALSETERLIEQEKVDALLGALLSAATFPATQAAEERKTPIIVPLGIADQITERNFKYTFRPTTKASWGAPSRIESIAFIGKVRGKKMSKIGLLFEDTEFGQSSAAGMRPAIKSGGYDLVADVSYPAAAADMSAYITKVKAAEPDVVFLFGYTADAINISKTVDRLGLTAEIVGSAGFADVQWLQNVGKLAESRWVSHLWNTDLKLSGAGQGLAPLVEKARKKWNTEPIPEWAIWYQSTWLMKEAFEKAGSTDKDKVRDALAKLEYTGPAFTMPFKGNKVTFGPDGQTPQDQLYSNILIQVQDGKYVTVWPEEFAAGKAR